MATKDSLILLEQTVIGHALNRQPCLDQFRSCLKWGDFKTSNHRIIAFCLIKMGELNINSPDEDSFQLVIGSYPENDKDYGGAEYIRKLKLSFSEETDNYKQFLEKFSLESTKARINDKHLERAFRCLNDPSSSINDVRKTFQSIVNEIDEIKVDDFDFLNTNELGKYYIEELNNRTSRRFCTTGFQNLDSFLVEGFVPGKLTVLAGFTGMAKSTMSIAMAHRISVNNIPVAYFSLEMPKHSVYDKIISSMTHIPVSRLIKDVKNLTEEEVSRIYCAIDDLSKIPLLVNDKTGVRIDDLQYQIKIARSKGYDIQVAFIDLFGKVEEVDSGDNLAVKIQRECKRMRILAQELAVHFILVVQIGRQGYGKDRKGAIKRPILTDIKNANAYAEESDLALLLHRNKYYMPELQDDILECNIAKHRMGEANKNIYFELMAEYSTIVPTTKFPNDSAQSSQQQ